MDLQTLKEELSRINDEDMQTAWFQELVLRFDHADELNDRKHFRSERRSRLDPHAIDGNERLFAPIPPTFCDLCTPECWEDIIYSCKPENLPELVQDKDLVDALRKLPEKRKEILFYRGLHGYSAEEIASYKGVSSRNIRKLYEKACREVRDAVDKQAQSN